MGAGTPLSKQYVVCLNSNMLGMPYEPASLNMSPDNTMRDNPNEAALHPLIRNWFGSQSPSTPHVNIDPYRRAMSLDYGYTYPLNGDGEYLINSYRYENPDDFDSGTPNTHTPYTYQDGTAVGPEYGSLGTDSYANFGLGTSYSDILDLRFNEIGWNESLPPHLPGPGLFDYSYGATWGSVVSPYYASLLDEENRDEWNEGIPYFDKYLIGTPLGNISPYLVPGSIGPSGEEAQRVQLAGQVGNYDGLFAHTTPLFWMPNARRALLFDHTFGYTNANTYNNEDPNLPDPLSPGVTVESTYNFYVDSSPNYEDVIAPANIPECILPNFYMLQSSILQYFNIWSAQRQNAYLKQVSAGTENSEFSALFHETYTNHPLSPGDPATSEGYWNLYSTTLSSLNPTAMTEFEGKYKNIVVPLGSLDFISAQNEASSFSGDPANPGPSGPFTALAAYPFYNKITLQPIGIPSDNDTNLGPERAAAGWITDPDFLRGLLDANGAHGTLTAAETTCFVRSLQLLIANSYNPDASEDPADALTGLVAQDLLVDFPRRPALSMDLNFMGNGFNEESDQPQEIQHTLGKAQPIKVCAEVDKILSPATELKWLTYPDRPYPHYYINLEKNTTNEKDINYSILRDAIAGNEFSTAATWAETVDGLSRSQIHAAIKDYTRNLNSVFKGQLSNVSPLMYLIEKRRIPDGELSVPLSVEPVQRIFITRDFRNPGDPSPITYYDTQIKYGVRYQYDVRVINIVFGTQYEYTNLNTDFPYTEVENIPLASSGRALGNALGFYNEENADVTTMGNYLVGGLVDGDGCQHNHLRLSDETDLNTENDSSLTNPTMYFSDEGELGWPSTPYQTDIGEDPGWDSANGTVFSKEAKSNKPVGQTGFYVFGGSDRSLTENHPVESLRERPGFVPWTVDFSDHFNWSSAWHQAYYSLQSTINDPYGSTLNAPSPGGMYRPGAVGDMLSLMKVKVVGGLGHDGNAEGGLVPWIADIEPAPEEEVEAETPVTICEWAQLYHADLAQAFRDWYTESREFESPTRQAFVFGDYKWHLESISVLSPTVWQASTYRDFERWFNGDSNCMTIGNYPVLWQNALADHQSTSGYEFVTGMQHVSDAGAAGRNTAAWYCPNWNSQITNHTIWRPHSIYQIVYWLLNGAAAQYQNNASAAKETTDPYDGSTARVYFFPKADLGATHGKEILSEFRNWWNTHYATYTGGSCSHRGVNRGPGESVADATQAHVGAPWDGVQWETMIGNLYLESCMGTQHWITPGDIAGYVGSG